MSLLQTVLLALLQGLTEFLPISSSAHLILVPILTGWTDQGLLFDLAVHMGSLLAVLVYFRRDLVAIVSDWFGSFGAAGPSENSRLGWAVIWATVPVGIAGLLFRDLVETTLRSPQVGAIVIALASIGFGLLLGLADWRFRGNRMERDLRWSDIAVVGVAQALALIPGASRSGTTMMAALLLGFSREAAARLSFLLSIPVIVLATALQLFGAVQERVVIDWVVLALGTAVAALSAYACIHYFLRFIQQIGMLPFVLYRIVLGVVLLLLFL